LIYVWHDVASAMMIAVNGLTFLWHDLVIYSWCIVAEMQRNIIDIINIGQYYQFQCTHCFNGYYLVKLWFIRDYWQTKVQLEND